MCHKKTSACDGGEKKTGMKSRLITSFKIDKTGQTTRQGNPGGPGMMHSPPVPFTRRDHTLHTPALAADTVPPGCPPHVRTADTALPGCPPHVQTADTALPGCPPHVQTADSALPGCPPHVRTADSALPGCSPHVRTADTVHCRGVLRTCEQQTLCTAGVSSARANSRHCTAGVSSTRANSRHCARPREVSPGDSERDWDQVTPGPSAGCTLWRRMRRRRLQNRPAVPTSALPTRDTQVHLHIAGESRGEGAASPPSPDRSRRDMMPSGCHY